RVVCAGQVGREAAGLTDRQAVLLGRGPDIPGALPAGRGPPGPARRCPPRPAGVLNVGRELLAERGGVLGAQVDLIVGALEGKPHRLPGRAASQIVFQHDWPGISRVASGGSPPAGGGGGAWRPGGGGAPGALVLWALVARPGAPPPPP